MSRITTPPLKVIAAVAAGTALVAAGILIDRAWLGSQSVEATAAGSAQRELALTENIATADPGPPRLHGEEEAGSHADDGELHKAAETDAGPSGELESAFRVELSPEALDNIGLTTGVVSLRPLERTLRFPGTVRMHPDGIAVVSTRIAGKVASVMVAPGDRVTRGQVLARVQSLVPGNPPPTVQLASPISGIVASRDATVGEAVQPNKELFRLIDPRRVVAEAQVPGRIVDQIALGQEAHVHRPRDHGDWSGRVSFIGSEADVATRTYPVWIELSADGQAVPRSGQFVEILVIESSRTVPTVPRQAVVEVGPLQFVFVQREHAFERRLVSTGEEDSQSIEILSGLEIGDTVAVIGSYELLLALESGGPGGAASAENAPHEH